MRHLLHLFLLLTLAVNAIAQQNTPRTLPTVADLVARPPATLASTTVGTNTVYHTLVITSGDTVAGTVRRTWMWSSTATAPTNTSAAGLGWSLAYPYGASSGRWLQVGSAEAQILQAQIDMLPGGGGEGTTTLDSMADLDAAIASGVPRGLYHLRGFYSDKPGIGGGWWYYDSFATNPVSPGVRAPAAGGRVLPVSIAGRIDPTQFGAYPGYTANNASRTVDEATRIAATDTAFQAALALSNASEYRGSVISLTQGYWEIETAIAGTNGGRLIIEGPSRAGQVDSNPRYQGGAVIRRMNFSGPIIQLSPEEDRISRLALEFWEFPTSTDTAAKAISTKPNEQAFKHLIEDVSIRKCAYGIYYGGSSLAAPNNMFRNVRIWDHAISAIWMGMPGSINTWEQIYVQAAGWPGGAGHTAEATALAFSGNTLTITLAFQPANLTVGSFVTLYGTPSNYSLSADGGQYVVTAIAGNVVTLQRPTAVSGSLVNRGAWSGSSVAYAVNDLVQYSNGHSRGGGPYTVLWTCKVAHTSGASQPPGSTNTWEVVRLTNTTATRSKYPSIYITAGCEVAVQGFDIEGVRGDSTNPYGALALYCAGRISGDYAHFEYFNPDALNNVALIRNVGGVVDFRVVKVVNCGLSPSRTCNFFRNENAGGVLGRFTIGTVAYRDLADVGGTWQIASSSAGAPLVNVGDYQPETTYRVNATSSIGLGTPSTFVRTRGIGGDAALDSSGLLSVTNGVLEGPTTLAARVSADSATLRTALKAPHYFRDYRPIVGTMAGNWGAIENYASFAQGVTVSLHVLPYDCTDLQLAWSGLSAPSAFTTPTERSQNAYEVMASWALVQSDQTTIIGAKRPIFWGGRRLLRVAPGSTELCNPIGGFFPAGTIVKVWSYTSRLKSDTTTIGGDVGQITSDQAYFPRHAWVGGMLNNNGIAGIEYSASTTLDTTLQAKVDGATAVAPNNPAGNPPAVIVGRVLSSTALFNSNAPVALAGMSITSGQADNGSPLENYSGLGWIMRAIGNSRPVYRSSTGGDGVQYRVPPYTYNWAERGRWIKRCPVVVVDLGTNDAIVDGNSADQIKSWLTNYWGILRIIGTRRIVGVTILPRDTSFDGWLTTNRTLISTNFTAKQLELNAWLPTQVGVSGGIDALIDPLPAVTEPGWGGAIWKRSTIVATNTAASGSTTSVVQLNTAVAANSLINRSLLIGTNCVMITSHSTTSLTVSPSLASTPSAGTELVLLEAMSNDAVHMTGRGHAAAATVLSANLNVLSLSGDAPYEMSFGE